jgi:Leucine-rich repeat (LRR) protein
MKLTHLDLSSNSLSGTVPLLPSALVLLSLASNSFSAYVISHSPLFWTLTHLERSTLPSTLGILRNLTSLDVHSNAFVGTLPTQLALLTSLTLLSTTGNALIGRSFGCVCVK